MKKLENQTGKVLFKYINKKVTLTSEGKKFLVFAEKVIAEYASLYPNAERPGLYIGYSYEQYPKFFNDLISPLNNEFSVSLVKCVESDFQRYFDCNEIDMFFSFYDWFDEYGSIAYQKLCDIPLSIVCGEKNKLFLKEKVEIADLVGINYFIAYLRKKNETLKDFLKDNPEVNFSVISEINKDIYFLLENTDACFIFPNVFNYHVEKAKFKVIPIVDLNASFGYFYRNDRSIDNDRILELLSSMAWNAYKD